MNTEKSVKELKNGSMTTVPFEDMEVRVYNTKDAIDDQVIMLVKNRQAVIIELPCFKNSIDEMTQYLKDEGLTAVGKLVSYHAAGKTFLPEVRSYLTASSEAYNTVGGGAGLIRNFSGIFGDSFDSTTVNSGEIITGGKFVLAGIEMEIIPDNDAFEVAVPAVKTVYMHMLGHDCHSIVAGPAHADAIIAKLKGYLDSGYELFLSSHYVPEDRNDVLTKIAYLEDLKTIASGCSSAQEFTDKVNRKYPGYSGANYLGMTAGMFFPAKQ